MNLADLEKEASAIRSNKEAVARKYDDYTLRKVRSNLFFDDEINVFLLLKIDHRIILKTWIFLFYYTL